jgi:predicted AAA+ superfamily ATPase
MKILEKGLLNRPNFISSYLLGIENTTQMARDPLRGSLVENLVILELIKYRLNKGKDPQLYYFRDAHGHEVDVIFQAGNKLIPIEIKAAATFNKSFLKNLNFFRNLIGDRYIGSALIYAGEQKQLIDTCKLLPYMHATEVLK